MINLDNPTGFELAGEDQIYTTAEAKIVNNQVEVKMIVKVDLFAILPIMSRQKAFLSNYFHFYALTFVLPDLVISFDKVYYEIIFVVEESKCWPIKI